MKKLILLLSAFVLCVSSFAQNMSTEEVPFNGVVKDLVGTPIKNARVWVVKDLESRTDKQGRFGLTNVQPTDTIYVKYKKQVYSIPVGSRKAITIVLGDNIEKDEVNIYDAPELADLGFGFVKRREQLTPTSGISGEVLRRSGQSTVLGALAGRVAGVQINGSRVVIRGIGSINSETDPLYLVDGCEVPSLDNVSVWDVESVEILKDGSMYGMRGANGVILVNTMRGMSKDNINNK